MNQFDLEKQVNRVGPGYLVDWFGSRSQVNHSSYYDRNQIGSVFFLPFRLDWMYFFQLVHTKAMRKWFLFIQKCPKLRVLAHHWRGLHCKAFPQSNPLIVGIVVASCRLPSWSKSSAGLSSSQWICQPLFLQIPHHSLSFGPCTQGDQCIGFGQFLWLQYHLVKSRTYFFKIKKYEEYILTWYYETGETILILQKLYNVVLSIP